MIAAAVSLVLFPLAIQGDEAAPLPGDDAPLRSQAFVRSAADTVAGRLADAAGLFATSAAQAMAAYRQALREASQESDPWTLVPIGAAERLYADLPRILRERAAALDAAGVASYRADAGAEAAAELARAAALRDLAARASAYPRTPAATAALSLVAERHWERGDLAAARSAWERLLATGDGNPNDREAWRARAAAAAAAMEPAPVAAAAPAPPVERWRAALPAVALPPTVAEPVERVAVEVDRAVLVQTASEILELDAKDGTVRARAELEKLEAPAPREPRAGIFGAKAAVGFPGKRRARPASDGRFVATTSGGVLRVFERAEAGFVPLWSRGAGWTAPDPFEANAKKESDTLLYCDGALLVGGRLFVATVTVASDSTVALESFDPATGDRHFRRTLAKGSPLESKEERRFAGRLEVVLPEPLAWAGGRVVVSTNLGIVASVDPLDGEVEYLLRVQRSEHGAAYEPGAPFASAGRVLVASPDSDYAYALEPRLAAAVGAARLPFAFDGAPLARRAGRNEPTLQGAFRKLVGASGSRAFFLGNAQVTRRRLQGFDFSARGFDDAELGPGEEPVGLPALRGASAYVPTNHGIVVIDVSGRFRDVAATPLPVDPATRQAMRAEDVLGDLAPTSFGLVSVHRSWVIRYDLP